MRILGGHSPAHDAIRPLLQSLYKPLTGPQQLHSLFSKASRAWAPMILPLYPHPRNPSHRRCSPNPKLLQIDVCVCVRRKRMFAAEPDGQGQPVLRIPSTRPFCLSAARKTLPGPVRAAGGRPRPPWPDRRPLGRAWPCTAGGKPALLRPLGPAPDLGPREPRRLLPLWSAHPTSCSKPRKAASVDPAGSV